MANDGAKKEVAQITDAKKQGNSVDEKRVENKNSPVPLMNDDAKTNATQITEGKKLAYSVEEKRVEHKNAYMPWTNEDDNKLEELFCKRISKKELCTIFGRNLGAINSRIQKLELDQKYDFR